MKPLFLTMKSKSGWTHVRNMCPCAAKLKNTFYINYLIAAHEAAHGRHMAAHGRHMGPVVYACGARDNGMKSHIKHFISGTWTHRTHGLRSSSFAGLVSFWGVIVLSIEKKRDCFILFYRCNKTVYDFGFSQCWCMVIWYHIVFCGGSRTLEIEHVEENLSKLAKSGTTH